MAFIKALQKLFKDYETLLNAYKPISPLETAFLPHSHRKAQPVPHLSYLYPSILSEKNKHLIDIQRLNYNYVMTEGLKDGKKQGHWFWWYFPKTNNSPGFSDNNKVIFDNSNQQQVTAMLNACDLDNWCNVINKLAGFLDNAKNIPADGGWNTSVLPMIDQDKAGFFIDFFLRGNGKPIIDKNKQFASFKTALQNLARTNKHFNYLFS